MVVLPPLMIKVLVNAHDTPRFALIVIVPVLVDTERCVSVAMSRLPVRPFSDATPVPPRYLTLPIRSSIFCFSNKLTFYLHHRENIIEVRRCIQALD